MPRGHKRDLAATREARFLDPRSFISRDGALFLYGDDWGPHREKLFERTKGQCEQIIQNNGCAGPIRCARLIRLDTMESHHVIERGKRGSDDLENLLGICHGCHQRAHSWRKPRWTSPTALSRT
jgi:5-methylcytosine-specific restriction endonuclease McrA